MDNDKNKKIILVLVILTVIFTIIGGSLAYFSWISSEAQKTNIVFTVERTFSCAADGGGSITNNSAIIVPTLVNSNTTGNYIKREVKVTPTINESGKTIYMDLWLDINKLDSGLSNSTHFNYAFTATDSYPTEATRSGNFNGKKVGDKVMLLDSETFSATTTNTYYLWIWLDAEETSSDTMDQSFSLSLNGSCTDELEIKPNAPDLDDGMIPVVISDTGVVQTINSTDSNWYNYKNKKWANVVLVNNNSSNSRANYLNTSGVTVNEDDILAYYVWIPRYKYKIWSVDNNDKKGKEQEIQIVFENKSDSKTLGTQIGEYRTHPAFTFGDIELNGIWVGKFETTGTAGTPTIKPNVQSLRSQKISAQFTTAQKLGTSTYGSTSKVDAHMMKNSEWGAVAYLSHSKYGVNREAYINNSSDYYTGRSGGNVGGSTAINTVYTDQTSTTQYNKYGFYTWDGYLISYGTNTKSTIHDISKVASTTGNITGVYDMSGGAQEYVMGVFANSDGTLWSGYDTRYNSGFTGLVGIKGRSYTGVDFPDSKYYDVYKADNGTSINAFTTACDGGICYGHGLSEVNNWYGDYAIFVYVERPWFLRGGSYSDGADAGAFFFGRVNGFAYDSNCFRVVLSPIGA